MLPHQECFFYHVSLYTLIIYHISIGLIKRGCKDGDNYAVYTVDTNINPVRNPPYTR